MFFYLHRCVVRQYVYCVGGDRVIDLRTIVGVFGTNHCSDRAFIACVISWPDEWGRWERYYKMPCEPPNPAAKTWHEIRITGINPSYNPTNLKQSTSLWIYAQTPSIWQVVSIAAAVVILTSPETEKKTPMGKWLFRFSTRCKLNKVYSKP